MRTGGVSGLSLSRRALFIALAFVVISVVAMRWPSAAFLFAGLIWLSADRAKPAATFIVAIAAAVLLFAIVPPLDVAIVALIAFAGAAWAGLQPLANAAGPSSIPVRDSLDSPAPLDSHDSLDPLGSIRADFESSGDGLWDWRQGADPAFWYSPRTLEILGRSPENVTGSFREFESWLHPDDRPRVRADLRAHLENSEDYEVEFRARSEAGEYRWVRGGARVVVGPNGLASLVSGTLRDISVRREAELALEESRRMLETVLDAIPSRVFWKDLDNVYLGCNQAFAEDAGLSKPAEIQGKTDFDLAFSDQAELYRADDQQVMQSGESKLNYEEPQLRPDGQLAWVSTSKIPLRDRDGNVTGVLGSYEDVTAHKQLEEDLRQAHKLEAVGRLAGGIAHDFNNVLTVILGNTEMLRQSIDSEAAGGVIQTTELDAIQSAGEWAASITRSLLAFSRREVVTPKVLDVELALSNFEPMLRSLMREDMDLTLELSPEPLRVLMDGRRLEEAILNLVINARDAMTGGGRLRITSDCTTIDDPEAAEQAGVLQGSYARITVEDDGLGMDERTLEHIFEPFYTTKGVGQGTGLGLAAVHGIVTGSGGQVRVVSSPGKGTCFTILLPAVERAEATEELAARSLPSGGNETVLLCEDDAEIRQLVRYMLESCGYRVLEGETARDVVAIARSHTDPIHLILTDVVMPELNGQQVVEQASEQHPESRVLFMSGYAADVISRQGPLPEGASFIQKPFSNSDLLTRVREALDSSGS